MRPAIHPRGAPGYTTAMSQTRKPRRRFRFQYSLRSLMLLVLLASLGMSWYAVRAKKAREQKAAVEEIRKLGGMVHYDYLGGVRSSRPRADPPGPAWLRNLLGDDFVATVVEVRFHSPTLTERRLAECRRFDETSDVGPGSCEGHGRRLGLS